MTDYHPNTTEDERVLMLAAFDHEVAVPTSVFDRTLHQAMRELIAKGMMAYLGKDMMQLTEDGSQVVKLSQVLGKGRLGGDH